MVIGRSQAKFQHESFGTKTGGAEEDRTPDPLLAKQVLSQLSYSPNVIKLRGGPERIRTADPCVISTVL